MRVIGASSLALYSAAKEKLARENFAAEIQWQSRQVFAAFTECDLLRELAWVILCSGFKESVVRRYFSFISLCFCDWQSAASICEHADRCKATALSIFNYEKKIDALIKSASVIHQVGFAEMKRNILKNPITFLQIFPFIGPITAFHLAKNLGFPTAKPDRHLQKMARTLGYTDVQELCSFLSKATGDPVQVVDIVLWRYAERGGNR